MPRFRYRAITGEGQNCEGMVLCASRGEALRRVRQLGHHPITVEEYKSTAKVSFKEWRENLRWVSTTELSVFTRQFSSLINAGMTMSQTLETLQKQCENPRLGQVLGDISLSVSRDGGSLADAMDAHPKVFGKVYRGLVRAGEEGGNLVEVMRELAKRLSQSAKLRGQVLGAFLYPCFLVLLGATAVFVLMSFVIPRFDALFKSLGQKLPLPTRILVGVSGFMSTWWWLILLLVLLIVLCVIVMLKRHAVRVVVDHQLLKIPVLGKMLLKLELARLTQTLGALTDSGVHILDSLRITAEATGNQALASVFPQIVTGVEAGDSLAERFEQGRYFPPMFVNLIRTGEDTGDLPGMLRELSDIYEDEAQRAITGSVKLIEPLLIVVMGGVIGSIVSAVIWPIFSASAMVQ